MAKNIEINIQDSNGNYEVLYPKTLGSLVDGTVNSATTASSCTGNSATATTLATERTIRTNLASTSTASFNGGSNITPGVTGTLGVGNGGTGVTSLATLSTNLIQEKNLGYCCGSYTGSMSMDDVLAGKCQVITIPIKAWQIRFIMLRESGTNFAFTISKNDVVAKSNVYFSMVGIYAFSTSTSTQQNLVPVGPGTYSNLHIWSFAIYVNTYYDNSSYKNVSILENQIAIGGDKASRGSSGKFFTYSGTTYTYTIFYTKNIN